MADDIKPVFFKFEIKQDVDIIALNIQAKIFAKCDRGDNIHDYRIIYWYDGKRYDEWVFEHEIKGI